MSDNVKYPMPKSSAEYTTKLLESMEQGAEEAACSHIVSRQLLYAIGLGASDPTLKSDTQRKALARDAAIVKAQYELLSYLKGVTLKGGIKVSRAMEEDSALESYINQLIRGSEIVRAEFTTDNGCVVTLRLPKSDLAGVMDVAQQ